MDCRNLTHRPIIGGLRSRLSFKGRSKLRPFYFVIALLLLIAAGCSLPEAPGNWAWNTHLSLPLGVRTYGLIDLVHPDSVLQDMGSGIGMSEDSILYFASFTDLTFRVDSSLYFEPITDTLIKPSDVQDTTHWFALTNQPHRVFLGIISAATVNIRVQNPESDVGDTARVVIANLIDRFGDSVVVALYVPGHTMVDTTLDLAGYRIRLDDTMPQLAKTRLFSSQPVRLEAVVQTSPIYFEFFDGVLNSLTLDSSQSGISVDLPPEGWESVHPTQIDLYLHIRASYTATAEVSVFSQTFRDFAVIDTSYRQLQDVYVGADTTIVIERIADGLNVFPDSVSTNALITVSGRIQSYTDVPINVTVEMRAALAFTLDAVHAPGDVVRVDAGDLKDIEGGSATIRIWNKLPVSGRAYLVADSDSMAVLDNSGADVDTVADVEIPMPTLVDGRPVDNSYTELTIPLSESLLGLIENSPFFARTDLSLSGSNGDTLIAHASDYVKVQIIADVTYRIDTGDEP